MGSQICHEGRNWRYRSLLLSKYPGECRGSFVASRCAPQRRCSIHWTLSYLPLTTLFKPLLMWYKLCKVTMTFCNIQQGLEADRKYTWVKINWSCCWNLISLFKIWLPCCKFHQTLWEEEFMTDVELDTITKEYVEAHPNCGSRSYVGYLRSWGLRVQRCHVRESLFRADSEAVCGRFRQALHRMRYCVSMPNSLYYTDYTNWLIAAVQNLKSHMRG